MMKFISIVIFLLASLVEVKGNGLRRKLGGNDFEANGSKSSKYPISIGSRPYFILESMEDGELKSKLMKCAESKKINKKSDWSIGHRGACLQYPEHTIG